MARANYSHSKRQRELVKKQKREEKMQRRLDKKNNPRPGGPETEGETVQETPEPTA